MTVILVFPNDTNFKNHLALVLSYHPVLPLHVDQTPVRFHTKRDWYQPKTLDFLKCTSATSLSFGQFIYLGFYVTFNTPQVISRQIVGRAEETSTYSSSGFCTVNCRPTASNYQLSHLSPCREPNPGLSGGRRECYHSAT